MGRAAITGRFPSPSAVCNCLPTEEPEILAHARLWVTPGPNHGETALVVSVQFPPVSSHGAGLPDSSLFIPSSPSVEYLLEIVPGVSRARQPGQVRHGLDQIPVKLDVEGDRVHNPPPARVRRSMSGRRGASQPRRISTSSRSPQLARARPAPCVRRGMTRRVSAPCRLHFQAETRPVSSIRPMRTAAADGLAAQAVESRRWTRGNSPPYLSIPMGNGRMSFRRRVGVARSLPGP